MKNNISSSHSKINLEIQQQSYPVFELNGEEALSALFRFEITLILSVDTKIDIPLLTSATLYLIDNHNNSREITGIITHIRHLGLFTPQQIRVQIVLQPLLARLTIAKNMHYIQNLSILDITKKLLLAIGYRIDQLIFFCNSTYSAQPYIVQAPGESDYDFFVRLLAQAGIFYWINSEQQQEMLYFCDNNQSYLSVINEPISYLPASYLNTINSQGHFNKMEVLSRLTTSDYTVNTFNPDISLTSLEANQSSPLNQKNNLEQHYFSNAAADADSINQEAVIRSRRAMIDSYQLNLHGNISRLSPGQIVQLNAWHFQQNTAFDDNYVVITLKHFAIQPSDSSGIRSAPGYYNEATVIPQKTSFCDAMPVPPKIPACWIGHIESDGYYPLLDEAGNYRLRQHFDLSNYPSTQASPPICRLTHFGGATNQSSAGKHLPLTAGTEVLLNCIHGNLNQPIIIGSLPNFLYLSPVTSANKTQNKLITLQDNLLLLDDLLGQQKIQLATVDLRNILELNATVDHNEIHLVSQQGQLNLNGYSGIVMRCGNNLIEQCGYNWWLNADQHCFITTQNKAMTYTAGSELLLNAKQNLLINSSENLVINSNDQLAIKSDTDMHLSMRGSSSNFIKSQGNITINSAKSISFIGTGKGELQFLSQGVGVKIAADGSIMIFGNIIQLQSLGNIFLNGPISM